MKEKFTEVRYMNNSLFDLKKTMVKVSKFKRFKIKLFGKKLYDIDEDGTLRRYYEYKGQYWVLDKVKLKDKEE